MQKLVIELDIPDKPRYSHQGKFDDIRAVLKGFAEALLFTSPPIDSDIILTHAGGQVIGKATIVDIPNPEEKTKDATED